jgi:hypothetical protein
VALNGNLLSANDESVETDISGWSAGGNTTLTQSTTHALDGTHSLRLASTTSGTISAGVTNRLTGITAGALYGWYYWLFTTVQITAHVEIDWYTATTYISTTIGNTLTIPANTWTQVGAPMVAVATTQQCVPLIVIDANASSQLFYTDEMFFGRWINPSLTATRQAVKRAAFY